MLEYEQTTWQQGKQFVAGVDEAGRGPLAGPVVAAAVIFPSEILELFKQETFSDQERYLKEINDSKKLTPKKREKIFEAIVADKRVVKAWSVIDAQCIDEINILNASYLAMQKSLEQLDPVPEHVLVDGHPINAQYFAPFEGRFTQEGIVKGDAKSLTIAAASILAKVIRDRMMLEYHQEFPEYGFDSHKGYGTKVHMLKIQELGPIAIHRKTFEPIKSQFFSKKS